jgi:hypothetical protein
VTEPGGQPFPSSMWQVWGWKYLRSRNELGERIWAEALRHRRELTDSEVDALVRAWKGWVPW